MKNQTCCFTGHRDISDPLGILKRKLKRTIVNLIDNGIIYFGNGGALGFDTLAALTRLLL